MHRSGYLKQIRQHLRSAYLLSDEKVETVLPRFLQTLSTMMTNLEQSADVEDEHKAMSRAAHALKGALLNLGLIKLADKAFQVEQHDKANNRERDCQQIIADLKEEIRKIC